MTDELYEKILKAIKECEWKNSEFGVDVCTREIVPCQRAIDAGKCPVIIKIMRGTE